MDATQQARRPSIKNIVRASRSGTTSPVPPEPSARRLWSMSRILSFTTAAVLLLTVLHASPLVATVGGTAIGVEAGVIRTSILEDKVVPKALAGRANSPTHVCTRWAHQSALVNGTLYVYGGQASKDPGQKDNTWNNDFLTIDVSNTWPISAPKLNGLLQPSGPPAVSLAYLWSSYTSLFLYGGEYSWKPVAYPAPFSLWEYNIASSTWIQHKNPQTSAGDNSDGGSQPVQEAAEGAGISIPSLGRGYFFGGHLDGYTTAGWSQSTGRMYLKSLIEFTFPGQKNDAVQSLKGGKTAGPDGVWRNVTQGGLQDTDSFPERADGVLVYVPGFGAQGIMLGLAGGTNETLTEMNVIDVYDIATSTWYKQATSGKTPGIRVNPCAVAASAPDGSSTNVYLYGGQNLIPAGSQTQYDDMWILTIPSFTWIQVNTSDQSVPPARAGHTCHIWDGQIIVVGGFVGTDISCDSPGIYVFNATSLRWENQFTALSGSDAQNQQLAQSGSSGGLSGSYGYQVPGPVQSVIGGNGNGGATITAPIATASKGPLATGSPIAYTVAGAVYTVTGANGVVTTETASAASNGGNPNGGQGASSSRPPSGPNIAAIVAGVIAGLLFMIICYLIVCIFIYRRQLALYKNHVAMSQRAAVERRPNEKFGFLSNNSNSEATSTRGHHSSDHGSGQLGDSAVPPLPGANAAAGSRTANSSSEDLLLGNEPTFVGVMLHPRRSLRIVNKD